MEHRERNVNEMFSLRSQHSSGEAARLLAVEGSSIEKTFRSN